MRATKPSPEIIRKMMQNLPKPPHNRVINSNCGVFCEICKSTKTRINFWNPFSRRSCDNPYCESHVLFSFSGLPLFRNPPPPPKKTTWERYSNGERLIPTFEKEVRMIPKTTPSQRATIEKHF